MVGSVLLPLGSYLLIGKNWNNRQGQLRQAEFIGQAVKSSILRRESRATPTGVVSSHFGFRFLIFCFLLWVVSRAWLVVPYANEAWTQDQSEKGMKIGHMSETSQRRGCAGSVFLLHVFTLIHCLPFSWAFFFFSLCLPSVWVFQSPLPLTAILDPFFPALTA